MPRSIGCRLIGKHQFRLFYPIFTTIILVSLLSACSSLPWVERRAVPKKLGHVAAPLGIEDVRIWGDVVDKKTLSKIQNTKRFPQIKPSHRTLTGRAVFNYLALSGGGPDGAYGAGLLYGWTRSGKRPKFSVVTGVSTGAIIAPFAFLGPKYDYLLKKFYTRYSTEDLLIPQPLNVLFGGIAVADASPIKKLVAQFITPEILDEIAREYKKGRYLLIGTTNLDAQRPVIWNMGEIAASKSPNRLQLFHDVVIASFSIPGVFPPVLIKANIGNESFSEMHVDGGTTKQVFFLPRQISIRLINKNYRRTPIHNIYIVRNSTVDPQWEKTQGSILKIAGRSISTLMKYQGQGNIFEIYSIAKRDNINFNLAMIPVEFKDVPNEIFDTVYMTKLFRLGYETALKRASWIKRPRELNPAF